MTISDQVIASTEEMVGKGHATKADSLNRGLLRDHLASGAHERFSAEFANDDGATVAANALVKVDSAERSYQKTVAADEGKFGYYGATLSSTPNGSKDWVITGGYAVVDWDGVGTPTIGTSTVTPSATAGKVKLAGVSDFAIGLVVKTAGLTNQLGIWLFGWRGKVVASAVGTLPGCRVNNSANISIPNATDTALTFDTESYDTDSMHSTVTNTSRITFNTAGKYRITGFAAFAANGTGIRNLWLRLNGATMLSVQSGLPYTSGNEFYLNVSIEIHASAGDYVELMAYQNSGGALNVLGSGGSPTLTAHFLGA